MRIQRRREMTEMDKVNFNVRAEEHMEMKQNTAIYKKKNS
jgi:hypothetical protein